MDCSDRPALHLRPLTDDEAEPVGHAYTILEALHTLPYGDPERQRLADYLRNTLLVGNPDAQEEHDLHERYAAAHAATATLFRAQALPDIVFYLDAARDDWVMVNTRTLRGVCLEAPPDVRRRLGPMLMEGKRGKPLQLDFEGEIVLSGDESDDREGGC